jgi:hypothetical protein
MEGEVFPPHHPHSSFNRHNTHTSRDLLTVKLAAIRVDISEHERSKNGDVGGISEDDDDDIMEDDDTEDESVFGEV